MVLPALAIVATAAGAGAEDGVVLERRWRALPGAAGVQGARVALDLRDRTLYALYTAAGQGGLTVRAYDMDRYTERAMPLTDPAGPAVMAATPVTAVERHRLAVVAQATRETAVPAVTVYGLRGNAVTRVGAPVTRFPAGYTVLGMAVDGPRDRLLVLAAPSGGGNVKTAGAGVGNVMVDTWRLADLANGTVASESVQPLRVPPSCGQVMSSTFPAGIMASPDGRRVYFGCLSHRGFATLLGPNAGDVSGVAELDLAGAATGAPTALRIEPVSGNYAQGDSFAVPGRGRFVLTAGAAGTTTIKVYDTTHGYYVGNVGLDNGIAATGYDPVSGRGFYVNGSGLGVFDAGSTPVDQGVAYEEHATRLGVLLRGVDVDPKTRRVFVVTADDVVNGPDPWIAVFRDRSARGDLSVGDVDDSGGLDVEEVPGRYESSRSADAAALGAELRLVGGPNSLVYNTTHFDSRGILTRPGTRWLQFGAARPVRLSRDEASVEVVTTRYDDASAADAQSTVVAVPELCSDFGYTPKATADDQLAVTCDVAKQVASGSVVTEPARVLVAHAGQQGLVPAPVRLRMADASAKAERLPDGTLLSTLTAEANGIDILGTVKIGRVGAKATVAVRGRPGTATTTYERTVTGLVVGGTTVCEADCPLDTVRQAVAQAFNGRVVLDFPEPYTYASKRGTVAGLLDDPYRHVERTMFDDVPADVLLTPAMEVLVYLDGTASSRFVATFAAVSAQEQYRIFSVGEPPQTPDPVTPPQPRATQGTAPAVTTGEPPVVAEPEAVEPETVAAPAAPGELVRRLRDGLKVVFRSPRHLAGVALLWALLALPTYLAARRRLLLDLPYLRRAVEESS